MKSWNFKPENRDGRFAEISYNNTLSPESRGESTGPLVNIGKIIKDRIMITTFKNSPLKTFLISELQVNEICNYSLIFIK